MTQQWHVVVGLSVFFSTLVAGATAQIYKPALKPGVERQEAARVALCFRAAEAQRYLIVQDKTLVSMKSGDIDARADHWYGLLTDMAADSAAKVELLVNAELDMTQRMVQSGDGSNASIMKVTGKVLDNCQEQTSGGDRGHG